MRHQKTIATASQNVLSFLALGVSAAIKANPSGIASLMGKASCDDDAHHPQGVL